MVVSVRFIINNLRFISLILVGNVLMIFFEKINLKRMNIR